MIQQHYLQIPAALAEKIRPVAEKLLAKSPKPLTSVYEKSLFLAQALKQNYQIEQDLPFFEENEDLVEAFLFRYQGGYGDHFATVLTMMLRSLGIPARLAVGFNQGRFNPFTGYYLVHNTDAHALTEVYFPNYGWFSFNPIPGYDLIPPSIDDPQAFSVLRQFWQWIASWLPSPVTAWINFLWVHILKVIFAALSQLWRFISGSWLGLIVGSIGATCGAFLAWLGLNQLWRWRDRHRLAKLPPMQRLYLETLQHLKTQGYPKHPAQTPQEFVTAITPHLSPAISSLLAEISLAYTQWRYGQLSPNLEHLHSQKHKLLQLLKSPPQAKIVQTTYSD
jgi:hypothetical protein